MNDQLRAWITPLLVEADRRGIDLTPERSQAFEGEAFNWELFGQLAAARLGLEGYPASPSQALANR